MRLLFRVLKPRLERLQSLLRRLETALDPDTCRCGSHLDEWGDNFNHRHRLKFECPPCAGHRLRGEPLKAAFISGEWRDPNFAFDPSLAPHVPSAPASESVH